MGLDMYFYERHYLKMKSGEGCIYPDVRVQEYKDWQGKKRDAKIIKGVKRIDCDFGYFRKANQIHEFFVNKYGQEEDINCKDIILQKEDIVELYGICKELLAIKGVKKFREKAKELLPCSDGFFFGSQEYDKYYRQDLRGYIKMVDKMDLDNPEIDYIYHCWY